jgi:hypothetical protein
MSPFSQNCALIDLVNLASRCQLIYLDVGEKENSDARLFCLAGYNALCELVGLNIGSTTDLGNLTAGREIRGRGSRFENGRSRTVGEITAKKDEYGSESRLILLLLRSGEHYLIGRFPPIFWCISLHDVRFCRCTWETASAAGNFDKTTARNFKLFVVLSGRAEVRPLTSATPRYRYLSSRSIGQQLDSQSASKKKGGERTLHL